MPPSSHKWCHVSSVGCRSVSDLRRGHPLLTEASCTMSYERCGARLRRAAVFCKCMYLAIVCVMGDDWKLDFVAWWIGSIRMCIWFDIVGNMFVHPGVCPIGVIITPCLFWICVMWTLFRCGTKIVVNRVLCTTVLHMIGLIRLLSSLSQGNYCHWG